VKTLPVLCHPISETPANDPAQLNMVPLPKCNFGSLCFLTCGVDQRGTWRASVRGYSDRMSVAGQTERARRGKCLPELRL